MDLIDRQAAIDAVVNTVSEIGLHDNSEVARYGATFRQHEILDIIEGIPSVQSEPIKLNIDHELTKEEYEKLRKDLADAPIVLQPERKTGRWIPQDWNERSGTCSTLLYCLPKCSVCGCSADYTNFCPNCGAYMGGDET